MTQDVVNQIALPRPLSARARARSWGEAPLRIWFVLLIAVGFATLLYVGEGVAEILHERNLIQNGIPVEATVKDIYRNAVVARQVRRTDDLVELVLVYKLPGSEKEIRAPRTMMTPFPMPADGSSPPMIGLENKIDIRVDPEDPNRWTNRTGLPEFGPRLSILYGLVPLLIIMVGIILLKRRAVLNLWRNGLAGEAIVIDARQSAMSPRSRMIRFTIDGSNDRRIRSALRPTHAGIPSNGERLPIVVSKSGSGPVIFADLYNQ